MIYTNRETATSASLSGHLGHQPLPERSEWRGRPDVAYRSSWMLSLRPVAAAVFVILASLSMSFAGTVSWKITTTNSWHIGTNWLGDAVPGVGDDVVITNAGAKVYLTNAVTNLSITLGGASSSSTLVISNWDTSLAISNVTILTNGIMTLPSAFTNAAMSNRVYIVCSNLTINGGGSINVDYQGYAGGSSTGEIGNGQGYGYGDGAATNAGGAGHGGMGGSSLDTTNRGAVYGSSNAPVYPGSGGGSGTNAPAGHGGGVVRISAQGTVAMAGTITANGQTPTNVSCGGGSGGSIFIICRTFTGTNGTVTASGGSADTNYCGGGGGGRVAILCYTSCFTNHTTCVVSNGASFTNDAIDGSLACGVLELTWTPLSFSTNVMQGYATNETLKVWNTGPGIISYTISTNVSWLSISNSVGTSTGNVAGVTNDHTVFYNTSDLLPGTHSGTITINADEGGQILMIDVVLTVNAQGSLGVSPGMLEHPIMEGQALTNETLLLWNTNSIYELGYEITESISWLSVSTNSGTLGPNATNTVTVIYTTTNLLAGTHTGTVTVVATNKETEDIAIGSPCNIGVTLTVNPRPRLSLSPMGLTNAIMQGHDAASQSFEVWNASGFYTMNYSISDSVPWLVTSVTSGSSTGERDTVTVSYSTMGLSVGTSNATIMVSGWDSEYEYVAASNSPQTIEVKLYIKPLAILSCDTGGFTNTTRQGQSIADASFGVWNRCSDPQSVLSYTITDDMDWVSVSPITQTNIPGQTDTITVSTDTSGLGPGTHHGTITINGVDESTGYISIGSPKEILVELTVTETIAVDFSGDGVSEVVVYHEDSGSWYILDTAAGSWTNVRFGGIGYVPVPGDYDGDGLVELGVYKTTSGNWYALAVGDYVILVVGGFGGTGYEPVSGDYDGDGRQDFAVYATGVGKWYVMSPDGEIIVWDWEWGGAGYSPVSGDYDGDGIDDMALYEDATGDWYIISKEGIFIAWAENWGGSGFTPVSGDYDGDGLSDLAVYHEDTGLWFITNLNTGLIIWGMECGGPGCTAVSGDYNGDGQSDLAVYYQGWWFIETINGTWIHYGLQWGGADSIPVGM